MIQDRDDAESLRKASPYLTLGAVFLSSISNIHFHEVVKCHNLILQEILDQKTFHLLPYVFSDANLIVNNFLIAADICYLDEDNLQHDKFVKTAIELCDWLIEKDRNSYVYQTNKYQAIKRLRKLSDDEKKEIIAISEETGESAIKLACKLLLDNQLEAEYYFDKLSEEQRESFRLMPIFRFSPHNNLMNTKL
jgi:hypothetical protein